MMLMMMMMMMIVLKSFLGGRHTGQRLFHRDEAEETCRFMVVWPILMVLHGIGKV